MPPGVWAAIDARAKQHGVSRSQLMLDAWQDHSGEIQATMHDLRENLAMMILHTRNLDAMSKAQARELASLQRSQAAGDKILHQAGRKVPASVERERARLTKAFRGRADLLDQLRALAEGRQTQPTLPVVAEAREAWGSWQEAHDALEDQT